MTATIALGNDLERGKRLLFERVTTDPNIGHVKDLVIEKRSLSVRRKMMSPREGAEEATMKRKRSLFAAMIETLTATLHVANMTGMHLDPSPMSVSDLGHGVVEASRTKKSSFVVRSVREGMEIVSVKRS
jgi:hypothetical protein